MNVKTIIPIYGLSIDLDTSPIQVGYFWLTTNIEDIKNFTNDNFAVDLGGINLDSLWIKPIAFFESERSETLESACEYDNAMINAFLTALWFVKDNAIYTPVCYLQSQDNLRTVANRRNMMFTNSAGEYTATNFTIAEFVEASQVFQRIQSLASNDQTQFAHRTSDHQGTMSTLSGVSGNDYNLQNRVMRAKTFLDVGRASSTLPMKIAYYTAVLECLFTTDNTDVSAKVKKRTSYYLGGDEDNKTRISKLVGKAYDVRSFYLHGQELENKYAKREVLVNILKELDQVLREVLMKVFFYDTEIFLKKNKDLRKYFEEVLLTNV